MIPAVSTASLNVGAGLTDRCQSTLPFPHRAGGRNGAPPLQPRGRLLHGKASSKFRVQGGYPPNLLERIPPGEKRLPERALDVDTLCSILVRSKREN